MDKPYGIAAAFRNAQDIYHAAEKIRDAGYKKWDVYTPFPIHGMDEAMGLKRSRVPAFALVGGVLGFFTGMLIAWYMGEYDYALVVGGKPFFSPIFPFPVAYEMTILLASFGAFFGMFITNRLPQHYHPVMNYHKWEGVMDDQFIIMIESGDPKFDAQDTRTLLENLESIDVAEIEP